MKLLRLVAFAAIITLVSCQKEISLDLGTTPGGGGGTGGGGTGSSDLLSGVVINTFFDTTTHRFSYNSTKKLTGHTILVEGMLSEGDFRRHISRDANGRIVMVKDSSLQNGGAGWDTTTTIVYYNGTATNAIYSLASSGSNDVDSIVYTYTGSNISKIVIYNGGPLNYSASEERQYTYDGAGNITTAKIFDLSGGSPDLQTESVYTFDSKISPFKYGADALIVSPVGAIDMGEHVVGPNNVTKLEFTDHAAGSGKDESTATYIYKSNNQPTKANMSYKPAGSPVAIPGSTIYNY